MYYIGFAVGMRQRKPIDICLYILQAIHAASVYIETIRTYRRSMKQNTSKPPIYRSIVAIKCTKTNARHILHYADTIVAATILARGNA